MPQPLAMFTTRLAFGVLPNRRNPESGTSAPRRNPESSQRLLARVWDRLNFSNGTTSSFSPSLAPAGGLRCF